MFQSTITYLMNSTNYGITNNNNMYNFMISVMETMNDEQKEKFIDNMKIHIGMTFYNNFKLYVFTKLPNSQLIQHIK